MSELIKWFNSDLNTINTYIYALTIYNYLYICIIKFTKRIYNYERYAKKTK